MKTNIFILSLSVSNKENSADYQRVSLLSRNSNVTTITSGPLPESLYQSVKESIIFPKYRWVFCTLFMLWKFRRGNQNTCIYSAPNIYPVMVAYLASNFFGYRYVVDFWDFPSLEYELASPLIKKIKSSIWIYLLNRIEFSGKSIISMSSKLGEVIGIARTNLLHVKRGVSFPADTSDVEQKYCQDHLRLVNVGWLYKIRGTDFMLDVLVELESRGVSATIRSAGYADQYSIDKVQKHNELHSNKLVDLGFLNRKDVEDLYKWANYGLCVLDSSIFNYKYAYPIKVYEYMANHVVNLASETLGTKEMIAGDVDGVFIGENIDSDTVSNACDALVAFDRVKWEAYAERGFNKVQASSIDNMEKNLLVIYKKLNIL